MTWFSKSTPESLRTAFQILSDNTDSELWKFLNLEFSVVSGLMPKKALKLGKLSKKPEPAGKIRVFAIADIWTQSVLKPYHEYLFDILRQIPQDGTFDQAKPLNILREKLANRSDK